MLKDYFLDVLKKHVECFKLHAYLFSRRLFKIIIFIRNTKYVSSTLFKETAGLPFKINYAICECLRGYCTPGQFLDCLCIFLKNCNTLVASKICFL